MPLVLCLVAVAVLLGVLVADGVFTVCLFALLTGLLFWRSHIKRLLTENALTNPLVLRSVTVRFSFAFALSAVLTLAADYVFYRTFGGVDQSGFLPGDVVNVLVGGFYSSARTVTSLKGWTILTLFTVLPLALVVVLQKQMLESETVASRLRLAVKLRQRGVEDAEDLKALESGAADALRYWMDARTNRLADVTAQFGFDRRPSYTDAVNARRAMLVRRAGPLAEHHGAMLLPREGLILGLQRADFTLAKNFAQTVIRKDPGDAQANFAIGMYNLMAEHYQKAIEHLEMVLKRLPEDPIVLNNLALCYDRLKHPDKALKCAERALKAAPQNQSIRENLERYRKAAEAQPLF